MIFEDIPTIPTADELISRSLRRAAAARREKTNRDRANEEFVRAVSSSIYDRLEDLIRQFPSFDMLPPFYREITDILFGIDRMKKSLGALGWAASQSRQVATSYARQMRGADDTADLRRKATARVSSIVHQIDKDLRFLNEARNVLRKLPDIGDEFTVVVAGYPNVGKSSFIRQVSSAEPQVAAYSFTTKEIIVGHHNVGRERVQFVDTPGILDRPQEERNVIERQALTAIRNIASAVLFIIDASEECGYPLSDQLRLMEEVKGMLPGIPLIPVVNKADKKAMEGFANMSTVTEEGVDAVLAELLRLREATPNSL